MPQFLFLFVSTFFCILQSGDQVQVKETSCCYVICWTGHNCASFNYFLCHSLLSWWTLKPANDNLVLNTYSFQNKNFRLYRAEKWVTLQILFGEKVEVREMKQIKDTNMRRKYHCCRYQHLLEYNYREQNVAGSLFTSALAFIEEKTNNIIYCLVLATTSESVLDSFNWIWARLHRLLLQQQLPCFPPSEEKPLIMAMLFVIFVMHL